MLEGLSITLTQWKNKGNISLHIAFIVSKENMTITSVGVDYRVTEVKTTGTDEYLVEETADEIDSMIDSVRSDAIDKITLTPNNIDMAKLLCKLTDKISL